MEVNHLFCRGFATGRTSLRTAWLSFWKLQQRSSHRLACLKQWMRLLPLSSYHSSCDFPFLIVIPKPRRTNQYWRLWRPTGISRRCLRSTRSSTLHLRRSMTCRAEGFLAPISGWLNLNKLPITCNWQGGLLWPKVWWSWWRRICLQRTNAHQTTRDQVQVD